MKTSLIAFLNKHGIACASDTGMLADGMGSLEFDLCRHD